MANQLEDPMAIKTNELAPITQAPAPNQQGVLQPVNQPGINDLIREAGKFNPMSLSDLDAQRTKLAQEKLAALGQVQNQTADDEFSQLQRKLHGQNVGLQSGIGNDVQSRLLMEREKRLEPIKAQLAAQLGEAQLADVQQERTRNITDTYNLVQSGQLTGFQAEEVLRQKGIDPNAYRTPAQVEQAEKDKQFEIKKNSINNPEASKLIDTEEELDFFLKKGKTYDQEVLDIIADNKSIADWKTKLPRLTEALKNEQARYENIISKTPDWAFSPTTNKEALDRQAAGAKLRIDKITIMINDIRAGVVPIDLGGY